MVSVSFFPFLLFCFFGNKRGPLLSPNFPRWACLESAGFLVEVILLTNVPEGFYATREYCAQQIFIFFFGRKESLSFPSFHAEIEIISIKILSFLRRKKKKKLSHQKIKECTVQKIKTTFLFRNPLVAQTNPKSLFFC